MRVQVNNPVVGRPDGTLRRDLGARRRRRQRRRAHDRAAASSSGRPTSTRSGSSSTTTRPAAPTPAVNVGDHFTGAAVGVMDYNFGNFKLEVTRAARPRRRRPGAGGRPPTPGTHELARRDVQRREPRPDRRARRSSTSSPSLIVDQPQSPDIVALEEVQDNNGPTNNGIVDATRHLQHADRGDPGGRRPDLRVPPDRPGQRPGRRRAGRQHPRRLPVPHRPRAGVRRPARRRRRPTADDGRRRAGTAPQLHVQPRAGSTRPTPAFDTSRKPLAGEFTFNGQHAVRDRQPLQLEGRRRAAVRPLPAARRAAQRGRSGTSRRRSSTTSSTRSWPPTRTPNVVVLGDLNDFEFSDDARRSSRARVLTDLIDTLPPNERYTLRLRGQLADARPHPASAATLRRATARLRRRPRQRRVRRPGQRPRSAGGSLRRSRARGSVGGATMSRVPASRIDPR